MEEADKQVLMDAYAEGTAKVFQTPKPPKRSLKVVDIETGELVEGYKIRRNATDTQKIGMNSAQLNSNIDEMGWYWVAVYRNAEDLEINEADSGRLVFLMTYASYFDATTGKSVLQHDNGNRMTRKQIQQLMGVGDSVFKAFMANVQRNGFISKVPASQGGGFTVNTKHFKRGTIPFKTNDDSKLFRMFRKAVRDVYLAMDVKQHRFLGMVYKLLPYVHYSQNIVCVNPTTTLIEEVKPMTLTQLAEILEYKQTRDVKRQLRKIILDDKPLFKFVRNNDYTDEFIIVNPYVVHGGNRVELAVLRTLFNY